MMIRTQDAQNNSNVESITNSTPEVFSDPWVPRLFGQSIYPSPMSLDAGA